MVQIHFEGTAEQVLEAMRKFLGNQEIVTSEKPAISLPKVAKASKTTEAPTETKTAETKASSPATVEDVKQTITQLLAVEKIGKPGVIKLFADHFAPAKKASELQPAQWGEFIEKANELMKG